MKFKPKIVLNPRENTVGKAAIETAATGEFTKNPEDIRRDAQKDYLDNLYACVEEFKKTHTGDFFVVVLTKREKLLPNVIRNMFVARISCPTPNYEQSVWKYSHADDDVEYIWTIPDRDTSFHLLDSAVTTPAKALLQMVLDFQDGTLFMKCKKLNKECKNTIDIERD